jgi:hypothetical protein
MCLKRERMRVKSKGGNSLLFIYLISNSSRFI